MSKSVTVEKGGVHPQKCSQKCVGVHSSPTTIHTTNFTALLGVLHIRQF